MSSTTNSDHHVYLRPGARRFAAYRHSKKLGRLVEEEVANLWSYCDYQMVVEAGATFEDFFRCLANAFVGFRGVEQLMAFTSCDFTLLLEDLRKPCPEDGDKMDYLEVYPQVEVHRWGRGLPTLTTSWGFHGWGSWPREKGQRRTIKGGWSVGLSRLYTLRDYELRIRGTVEIDDSRFKPRYERRTLLKAKMVPTLLEFVKAILWELSFYGPPADRDGFSDGLREQVEDIKSGKAKTVPWSAIKKTLQ